MLPSSERGVKSNDMSGVDVYSIGLVHSKIAFDDFCTESREDKKDAVWVMIIP